MPHVNSDEGASDEKKTYSAVDDGDAWQDSKDLDDIKVDLVDEDDKQPYDSKASAPESGEGAHRVENGLERDHHNDFAAARQSFPYPMVSGLGSHPLFPNGFLPPSSQLPYSPYMGPYVSSFFCGNSPPLDLDFKQGPPIPPPSDVLSTYALPGQLGHIPNPLVPWHPNPLYPLCTATMASMLRYPNPFHSYPSSSAAMGGPISFPHAPPHPQIPHSNGIHPNGLHPGRIPPPGLIVNGHDGGGKSLPDMKQNASEMPPTKRAKTRGKPNRPYVKKPLNAFMIFMKEQRAQVVAECTLKESAAINQILGKKWHSLKREEQQKYYDIARQERQMHLQMFPDWSARDNYGKRKKKRKEKTQDCTAQTPKKCRAVFGLDQQQLWCAPCRRKKKCIRHQPDGDDSDESEPSPEPLQRSPENLNVSLKHSSSFDSIRSSSSSAVASSNDYSVNSSLSTERSSPDQAAVCHDVKQERSPPVSHDHNTTELKEKSSDVFYPPTSDSERAHKKNDNVIVAETPATSNDITNRNDVSTREIEEESHFRLASRSGFTATTGNLPDARRRRSSSRCDSFTHSSNLQSPFNSPMLSPSSVGLGSPHSNTHHFLPPQFSYFATAASLPTSPLSGLMGFAGLQGLGSPVGIGFRGDGPSVPAGNHPGPSAPQHAPSVLEGKS